MAWTPLDDPRVEALVSWSTGDERPDVAAALALDDGHAAATGVCRGARRRGGEGVRARAENRRARRAAGARGGRGSGRLGRGRRGRARAPVGPHRLRAPSGANPRGTGARAT